jgi:outer membrane protein OmpA-like peptidoglycan-associated protein
MDRRHFLKSALAAGSAAIVPALPGDAFAQTMPSASEIIRKLENDPRGRVRNSKRVSPHVFKKSPELRHIAPSIDIQAINFAFGSAHIPPSQRWKVERIADAIKQMLWRNHYELFLLEGHTDAVGSFAANQRLSERRAASVAHDLIAYFGVPRRAIDTIGYGEQELLVPTPYAEWRNRRVTLRRMTPFVTRR